MREICDRYGILLSADEVITGFGRLGDWFGSERYDIRPDLITCAKGLSSGVRVDRRRGRDRPRLRAVPRRATSMFTHGITFGGHPVHVRDRAAEHRDHEARADLEDVLEHEDAFRRTLEQLLDLPIVGDVRGAGFFYALELVKDKETRDDVRAEESRVAAARLPLAARCSSAG